MTLTTRTWDKFIFTACFIFHILSSCSLLKDKHKASIQTEQEAEHASVDTKAINSRKQSLQIIRQTDSAEQHFYTEIVPDGLFTYSADSGFKGRALSIKTWTKNKAVRRIQDSIHQTATASIQTEIRRKGSIKGSASSEMQTKNLKTERGSGWYWILTGLIGALLVLYLLRHNWINWLYRAFK